MNKDWWVQGIERGQEKPMGVREKKTERDRAVAQTRRKMRPEPSVFERAKKKRDEAAGGTEDKRGKQKGWRRSPKKLSPRLRTWIRATSENPRKNRREEKGRLKRARGAEVEDKKTRENPRDRKDKEEQWPM